MEEKSEKEVEISRRDLLRMGATLGVSLTALSVSSLDLFERGGIFPSRKERHLTETPEGAKIGMVLGLHEAPGFPFSKTTPIKEKDLFFPVGAIFLDECIDYLDPKIQEVLPIAISNEAQTKGSFVQEPLKYALENNYPIILGDITLRGVSADDFVKVGSRSLFFASISSAVASGSVSMESLFRERFSRRKFFKVLGIGGALSAIHFSSEAIVRISRQLGIKPESEIGRDFQSILADINHPEHFAIVMRNIIWALKCRDFYERGTIPKDRIINVIGGAGHQFFDFFVRHPEIARRYWYLFGYK
ncbi:MAG: hypothetical protein LiPW16_427, partial [Microgenomates group bacterium LiPW_16]